MGLAASQCRFLMLTSRESDVEAKLMTLSNQQMSLTAMSSKLASDYAKALSAQSVNFNDQPISYSIMQPNLVEDINGVIPQYLFKTSKGAVILSPGKAQTCGLLPAQVGGKTVGSGADFRALYPTNEDFFKKVLTNYTPSSSAYGSSLVADSGYKYSDKIMNDAVITGTSASVAKLSGYGDNAELEYAMGTQETLLDSYACVWTLDKYQYTEANVHFIVNDFVGRAVDAMSEVMKSDDYLGESDATKYATNYAIEKTLEYYRNVATNGYNKDVLEMLDVNSESNQNLGTNPLIRISEKDYTTTTTTGSDDGNLQIDVTSLNGKDIFVDTAQLTAVYLNFFDAGMMYAMADAIDKKEIGTEFDAEGSTTNSTDEAKKIRQKANDLIKLNYSETTMTSDGMNPLEERRKAQRNGTEGVNGYNANIKVFTDDKNIVNGTTGYFGDTVETNSATGSNTTAKAQKAFYQAMYDSLCSNGWSYNESITNGDFLSTNMQRQNILLYEVTTNTDKHGKALSLDDYTSGLSLVDSDSNLEAAEAAYQAESAKIDYKSNIIEQQMKNLETELQAIQAEKESVKGVLEKKTEKFQLFG